MSVSNQFVFRSLQVIAWIIFIGLSIEAGGLLVNFIVSLVNPAFIGRLYQKLDLTAIYQNSRLVFFGLYGFVLTIALLKATLFYVLILVVTKLDLAKPFNYWLATQISRISYFVISIGLLSYIGRQTAVNMQHHGFSTDALNPFWADSQAYILMAAVVYIIAVIFKKGVELQTENDLTV